MANTKITTNVLADESVTSDKLAHGLTLNNASAGATVATFEGNYSASGDVKLASFERINGAVAAAVTYADAATAMEFGTTTSHPLLLTTGDTERWRIDASGHFTGVSGSKIIQTIASGGGNFLEVTHSGNEAWSMAVQSGSGVDDYLDIGINGGTRAISIHEDGKVGIGETSPGSQLQITSNTSGVNAILTVKNAQNNRESRVQLLDESNGGGLVLNYDNGGNAAYIKNNVNGALSIYLGGTGTANELDDYEEGTWTPACGATLATAVGHYTKIGNQVTVHYHIVSTGGLPTSTSQVIITGLPFTSNSSVLSAAPIYARYYTPNDSTLTSLIQDSETQIRLINTNDQNFDYTIWGELEASHNNSIYIIGTATYQV